MPLERSTEQESNYRHLETMSTEAICDAINNEDQQVALAVKKVLPYIVNVIDSITDCLLAGGRLFYIGAGTSGRLGVLDASECPPTFGVPTGLIIGIIAGGDKALQYAVEKAEDSTTQGWIDLQAYNVSEKDLVIGITASGTTPYVIAALQQCKKHHIATACITCNSNTPLAHVADLAIECKVGPEFVTGSTRMKSGTAQKLILNMISTAVMIKMGRVEDNKMVNMQLTNDKLIDRGTHMLMHALQINDYDNAKNLLLKHGSVKKAMQFFKNE
jgi:N-acetylmuramic acid 6-phosphate etherase